MRSTHSYAVLEISPAAHAEIKAKLLSAGYQHAIHGETIDMQGIAVEPEGPNLGGADAAGRFRRDDICGSVVRNEKGEAVGLAFHKDAFVIQWPPAFGESVTVTSDSVDGPAFNRP